MKRYRKGRGPLYYEVDGDLVTVTLCDPDSIGCEAEHILTISRSYLPELVATLNMAGGK